MSADRDALADLLVFTPMGDLVDTSMAPVWRTVDQILASDWLAERDARLAAEARKVALEEAALAIEVRADRMCGCLDLTCRALVSGCESAAGVVRSLGGGA